MVYTAQNVYRDVSEGCFCPFQNISSMKPSKYWPTALLSRFSILFKLIFTHPIINFNDTLTKQDQTIQTCCASGSPMTFAPACVREIPQEQCRAVNLKRLQTVFNGVSVTTTHTHRCGLQGLKRIYCLGSEKKNGGHLNVRY